MEESFAKQCTIAPRRSERQKKLKSVQHASNTKKKYRDESSSESESDTHEIPEKPTVLHDNEIVSGNKIFTFQTRKKCEAVVGNSPQVSVVSNEKMVPKTPHTLRNKMKKHIEAKLLEEDNSDFSDSGSEYVASNNESESDGSDSSESSDNSSPHKVTTNKRARVINLIKSQKSSERITRSYTIKTDDYFSNHSSKKIVTSNHTLDKLETSRLPQDQLHKLLSSVKLCKEHEKAANQLVEKVKSYFHKWLYLLHENINVLLYGLGSKKDVLNSFHKECLNDLPTIVVNGFFPSLTIKDILDGIIVNLLEFKENPANIYEACDFIEKEFSYIPDTHLYIIVHNIDMMRSSKAQNVFARLAFISNIHLIASIDHINAPLIWDHSKLSKFNFTWWDVTTFQPYIDETSYESSMMVQNTATLALSSLRNVFLSLTTNSKGIYLKLAKYQIANGKKQYYQGLSFKDLYSSCREAFLVSSDLALRAQLSEFVDHKMVKFKRAADGTEYLIIPISNTVLQEFVSEHS